MAYKVTFFMAKYFAMLLEDVRMREGLTACMNCGVCTGVCPAAAFYNYDPRQIVCIVQTRDDEAIEALLKSETIWYCGECMSCRPRCPRGNTPAYVIQALRTLSQKLGFFVESEQGTVWKWIIDNDEQIYGQFTPVYGKEGAGALRKVTDETLEEIHRIFEVTGGTEMFEAIEQHSDRKAREMGFDGADEEYFMEVFTKNSNEHY